MLDAAQILQSAARVWAARRAMWKVLEERLQNRAAATIQESLRRFVRRRKLHRRRVAAGIVLQRALGKASAYLARIRRRRKGAAATVIQNAYRTKTARAHADALRSKRRESARVIQRSFRNQQRRVTENVREDHRRRERCTLMLQQAWKRRRDRERTRAASATKTSKLLAADRRVGEAANSLSTARTTIQHENGGPARQSSLSASIFSTEGRDEAAASTSDRGRSAPDGQLPSPEKQDTRGSSANPAILQSAVQAVANGMATRGDITANDARDLKHIVDRDESDSVLEDALRQRLAGIEVARFGSMGAAACGSREGNEGFESKAIRDGLEEALERALVVLERRIVVG